MTEMSLLAELYPLMFVIIGYLYNVCVLYISCQQLYLLCLFLFLLKNVIIQRHVEATYFTTVSLNEI